MTILTSALIADDCDEGNVESTLQAKVSELIDHRVDLAYPLTVAAELVICHDHCQDSGTMPKARDTKTDRQMAKIRDRQKKNLRGSFL